jgi:hypothetical protein
VLNAHQRKEITINYKEAYKLWVERNPMKRINIDAKLL